MTGSATLDAPFETPFETVADGFAFCEAPRADADGTVWFSDLLRGGYYRVPPGGAVETVLADRLWIGGAVRDADGGVVCGGKGGLVHVRDGRVTPLLDSIAGRPIVGVNDIEGDGRGGLFGGTIDFAAIFERGEAPSPGHFFHLAADGTLSLFRDDVVASNGLGFSPDGTILYHSESTVGIWAWTLGADGMPRSRALLIPADDCDGLVVDAAGGIWVAFWRDAVIRRYRPDGTLDRTIGLPFPHVISLSFGGADGRDLVVATGDDARPATKGGVVRIRADVAGQPEHRCSFGQG